jgi:L,D-peptidoglycan transpeptidase YkuD (ErfK/YbiS/YcfS/YnhG family)
VTSRAVLVAVLAVLLAGIPNTSTGSPLEEHAQRATYVVLDGVRVRLPNGTTQVVTVNHTRGHHARVSFWARNRSGWVLRQQVSDGRIGYGGLVPGPKRKQGTGTTPLGTYRLPYAFGTQRERDGWEIRYRPIRRGDYWVQDNASRFYNRYRNKRQGGFRWWLPKSHPDSSERLLDYRRQYQLSVVVDFNPGQVRHRGAGIFLHVNGSGATAGCVSVPRPFLQKLMSRLDTERGPVIAVGR